MGTQQTTFVRTRKDRDFSVINNTFLRDKTLSAQAKGVFAYLLSLPEDWVLYQSELVKNFTNGIDSIRTIINELITHGYLKRERVRNSNGCYGGCNYFIIEVPEKDIDDPDRDTHTKKEEMHSQKITKCGKSKVGEPTLEIPTQVKPTLLNTNNNQILNKLNTDISSHSEFNEQSSCSKNSDNNIYSALASEDDLSKVKSSCKTTSSKNANAEKSFPKTDYQEIYELHKTITNTLSGQGKIRTSSKFYNHKLINSMLKKLFNNPDIGKETVKKALLNAVNDKWCVEQCDFELQPLLSEKVITREAAEIYFSPYIQKKNFSKNFAYGSQNFEEGGF